MDNFILPRSGTEFKEILNSTRKALEERSKLAESDLENFQSMPEPAADSIRMATGKANLLNRKKLPKFDELVRANLVSCCEIENSDYSIRRQLTK